MLCSVSAACGHSGHSAGIERNRFVLNPAITVDSHHIQMCRKGSQKKTGIKSVGSVQVGTFYMCTQCMKLYSI